MFSKALCYCWPITNINHSIPFCREHRIILHMAHGTQTKIQVFKHSLCHHHLICLMEYSLQSVQAKLEQICAPVLRELRTGAPPSTCMHVHHRHPEGRRWCFDNGSQADQNKKWVETTLLASMHIWMNACISNQVTTMINLCAARIPYQISKRITIKISI